MIETRMINNSFLKLFGIAALLLPLFLFNASRVAAQANAGDFTPGPCPFEGIEIGPTTLTGEALGFECGYVTVPERHANPDGPTIRIPVAIHRAASADTHPDPLVIAQGGPGGDAFEVFSFLLPNTEIAADRDIVIFNQRGTPYADPVLDCPELDERLAERLAATVEEERELYNEALLACYARLQDQGIDLSAYNSLENAADVPAIIRALGYDDYNFYGVSYGTLLGLHLMRNHPEGLRSVILDSVVTTDINFISEIPASENRVFGEVFAACESDPTCREQYPDLEERFYALLRQYDENPVIVSLVEPDTGTEYDTYLDGEILRSIFFQLLYLQRMHAVLPKMVADLERGDTQYLEIMWPLLVFDQKLSEGMYFSVICAEDADIDVGEIPIEQLRPEIAESARESIQSYVENCTRWAVTPLPSSIDDPVTSQIPTLLLSGLFDPITPPAFAAAAANSLPNATALVDPTGTHGANFLNPCVTGIIHQFLSDPSVSPDAACLAEQQLPAAVPPNAITVPLLGDVNSLNVRVFGVFGIAGLLLAIILSPFIIWPSVYIVRRFGDEQPVRGSEDERIRLLSRIAVLIFGVLAVVYAVGLMGFIIQVVATDLTLATAMALPPSAAPILWIPLLLMLLTLAIIITGIILWRRPGAGSVPGKIYYSLIAAAAVALVILIASQDMLLPL